MHARHVTACRHAGDVDAPGPKAGRGRAEGGWGVAYVRDPLGAYVHARAGGGGMLYTIMLDTAARLMWRSPEPFGALMHSHGCVSHVGIILIFSVTHSSASCVS